MTKQMEGKSAAKIARTKSTQAARTKLVPATGKTTLTALVGVRTEKDRAKALAKPKGGKPGQALHNQSAGYSKGELDAPKVPHAKIASVTTTRSGPAHMVVTNGGGETFLIRQPLVTKEFTDAAVVGGSFATAKKIGEQLIAASKKANPGHLANGLNGHNAPNSTKAITDHKAGKGAVKPAPADKGRAAVDKVAKAAKTVTTKPGADRGITVLVKKATDTTIRPDTDRFHKLEFVIAAKPKKLGDVLGKEYIKGKVLDMGSIQGMVKRGHVKLS